MPSSVEPAIRMDDPICLIENRVERGRTKLVVNPEAINILSKIHQPVVVVSIVGLYRTGKSYLMNRLAGAQKGFSLGATIQSETKGIWMWCVPHPIYEDHVLVLLDTEGLGDVEKGDRNNDSKIFALAVLLSSALVYNSMGTINQDALDKLKFVGEITELIKLRTEGDIQDEEAHFSRYFPIFIWAVRDFSLELKIDGKMVSADDYLENALKLKIPERSSEDEEYNAVRNRLRMYFGKRRCFVFDTPTDSRKLLKDLEDLSDNRLNEDFVAQSAHFCDYIINNAEFKRVDITVAVTGQRLGELAKLYTEAINSSNIVCLEEAVVSLAETENTIAVQEAIKFYEDKIRAAELPTETLNQFLDMSRQFEDEARKIFLKRSFKDKDQKFLQELMVKVEQKRTEISLKNETKSREVCKDFIKRHSADFEKALTDGTFRTLGGHGKFRQALKAVEQKYKMEKGKGVKAEEVLKEYMMSKQTYEIFIIQEDNALSQKQKEEEERNTRRQIEEMIERIHQLEEEQNFHRSQVKRTTLQMTVQQLQEKLEEERRIENERLEQVIEEKQRERDLYLVQNHEKQAKKYDEHIEALQNVFITAVEPWISYPFEIYGAAQELICPPVCPPECPPFLPQVCPPVHPPVCPPEYPPFLPQVCPPVYPPECPPVCVPVCPPECPPLCPPVNPGLWCL